MRRTFSDNWYRIAPLRIGLRNGVQVKLHYYRNEPWYVLHETAHAGFFRVNPSTYYFISRLTVETTLDEVWRAAVAENSAETPGQEEVFELISSLYRANLIYVEGGVDESKILERFARKKHKKITTRISEMLFMRIPLWDPEPLLRQHQNAIHIIYSKPVGWGLLLLFLWASIEFALAGSRAWNQATQVLQLDNLLLLYLAIFISHFIHEMSHAAACKRFGGEVRTMGVMLLLLTPLPYVDLSSSWTFRNRWQRVFVDAAGMIADVVVGSLATLVWVYSPPGMVNELAYNLMFSTVIYTLLFNINPLMRFDGYYMLSDWLDIPNLHEQAKKQFDRWWKTRVLKMPDNDETQVSQRRFYSLSCFFVASNVYRLFVMLGIVLFIADQYFGIGLLAATALAYTAFIQPLHRTLAPLRNPLFRFQQQQWLRRVGLAMLAILLVILLLPLPESRTLTGVVEARYDTRIYTESGGIVHRVAVQSGQTVTAGQLLIELYNPELQQELASVAAQYTQAQIQEGKAISEGSVDLAPIRERLKTLAALKTSLLHQQQSLQLKAPHAGIWVAPEASYHLASWVGRGAELGRVVDDSQHVFSGVIHQEDAVLLAGLQQQHSRVRIEGERQFEHQVSQLTLVPHSQKKLPSAALSPLAGGEVAVTTADPSGTEAVEYFFLLRAELTFNPNNRAYYRAGRSGWIKIDVGPRPLAMRAWQAASQYLQRRYRL